MSDSKREIWKKLRLEDTMGDVVLKVDGVQFRAHKIILSACSEYFRVLMTSSHWTCSKQREYTILDVSPDIMELIIEYAYSHKADITSKNVVDLLIAADNLDIQAIKSLCCSFLEKQLCPENCISMWMFSELYSCPDLYQKAYTYMLQHFEEVILEPVENFLELTLQQLSDILDNNKLSVKREETVFEAVKMWIGHAPQLRSECLPVLLQKVRMGLMNPDYFLDFVMKDPLVCFNQKCQPIITRALGTLLRICRNGPNDGLFDDPLSKSRLPGFCLFALSGWNGSFINAVEVYHSIEDCWSLLPWVDYDEIPRGYYGTAVLDGDLYVLGGSSNGVYFNTVKKFNPFTQTWHQAGHMQSKRCYVSVAVLDGLIYAMGGHDGRDRMSSVERYDPKTNQWSLISSMQLVRSDASATALNGKIYICGGYDGQVCLFTAECFDPLTDQWSFIAPMQSSRSGLGVAALKELVFAVGGYDGLSRVNSVESYNPGFNQWTTVIPMFSCRSNFGIEVLNDRLFVVGGYNGVSAIASTECYDAVTNEWYCVEDMRLGRSALKCFVL